MSIQCLTGTKETYYLHMKETHPVAHTLKYSMRTY